MRHYLRLGIGIIAISSASILIKFCDAPSMVIAMYRLAFASLLFITTAGVKKTNPLNKFHKRDLGLAFFSALFLCGHFAAWITSLDHTSVASSVVLVSTSPVFVAIGSIFFLKQKPGKLLIFGITFTLIGAVILSSKEFGVGKNSLFGNVLALAGAIGIAGHYLIGKVLRARIDTFSYVTIVYSITALFLVFISGFLRNSFFDYNANTYLLFFLIAFVPQVIGHTTLNWALKLFSATTVAVITLSEPIGASILAFFLLGEKITGLQFLGGFIILTGVAFALRGDKHNRAISL